MSSAPQDLVERGAADLCGLRDGDLRGACTMSDAGEPFDLLHSVGGVLAGVGPPLALDGEPVEDGFGLHGESVNRLTPEGQ